MSQPSFISPSEAQAEYVKAVQSGHQFTRHGNIAHYLFRRDQLEPGVRAEMEQEHGEFLAVIWSFKGCTMVSCEGHHETRVTPLRSGLQISDWTYLCPVF